MNRPYPYTYPVMALSPIDISIYLLSRDIVGLRPDKTMLRLRERLCYMACIRGLDLSEDRLYDLVWLDIVHTLMSVFKEYQIASVLREVLFKG